MKNSAVAWLTLWIHKTNRHNFLELFNCISDTGNLTDSRLIGIIKSIYKNKDPVNTPNNHRPVTVLYCLEKLFISGSNDRLTSYIEASNLLYETKVGSEKAIPFVTIFALYAITDYMKERKLKPFCTFVDFSKAFDTVEE